MSQLPRGWARSLKKTAYWTMLPFSHKHVSKSVSEAREVLNKFSPCPTGSSLANNRVILPHTHDLQIIVPAYNVEEYLRDCMDSILGQVTKYTFKVVLIDDGSSDSTGAIADEYADDARVQVIHQKNKGFSGARNTGLNTIWGKYIAFVDSDDKLMPGAIEALMDTALRYDADIVEGGFYQFRGKEIWVHYQHDSVESVRPLGKLRGYPCGKVFKHSLFAAIHFPEQFWFEDSINSFIIYPQVEKAWLIPDIVYAYRQNLGSISHTAGQKPKCIDTYWITERLMDEYDKLGLPANEQYYAKIMRQIILNAKRIKNMPEEIQQSVFVLTGDLLDKHLKDVVVPNQYSTLLQFIRRNDFGAYRLYCRTH